MKGQIDTSFVTHQRDLFTSGLAAQIGMNAFGVWLAIKSHSDYNTGQCWPGMRLLSELLGLSIGAVHKSVQILLDAKLLRLVQPGKGKRSARYVARERVDVRFGSTVVCTIVIDYVPNRLRERLEKVAKAVSEGNNDPDAYAQVDIIPVTGFVWDASAKMLRSTITVTAPPASEVDLGEPATLTALQKKAIAMKPRVAHSTPGVHVGERHLSS